MGKIKGNILNIGTFNVRGISSILKQEQLCRDMNKYNVDICCIQETKCKSSIDTDVNGYRLITLPTNRMYGNGFVVSPKWKDKIHSYWKVSERISIIKILTEKSTIKSNTIPHYRTMLTGMKLRITKQIPADHMITIINVYAPHT